MNFMVEQFILGNKKKLYKCPDCEEISVTLISVGTPSSIAAYCSVCGEFVNKDKLK